MKLGQLVAFVSRKAREAAVPPGVAPEDVVPADAAAESRDGAAEPADGASSEGAADASRDPLSD